ncbi:hypothetical protein ACWWAE_04310 [Xylella fastidiosa subsp. multiplex]|uniref:hypothetical protein n=1 Tax=Xylella fastidiosa TaxID=2371 RepID=UPI0035D3DB5F
MSQIPHANEPFLDAAGCVARSWRTYLASLASSETRQTLLQLQQQMSALQAALDSAHSGPPAAQLQAIDSLNMVGTLASGLATLRLEGDTATPGASCYYGTNANGVKGWHPFPTRVTG